jgi:hypothetical protein
MDSLPGGTSPLYEDPAGHLYSRDRNLKFHLYDLLPATANVDALLAEVDADPTAIFWG